MKQLEVRIVKLEAMRVAAAHGFGNSPEEVAWDKLLTWAGAQGLLAGPYYPRFFGFNNPNPSPASPNYGYEQWMTVPDGVTGNEEIEIKEVPGAAYAVVRFKGLAHIGQVWQELVAWVESSPHRAARHQCLEELLTPPTVPPEEYIFDLYMPIIG